MMWLSVLSGNGEHKIQGVSTLALQCCTKLSENTGLCICRLPHQDAGKEFISGCIESALKSWLNLENEC